MPMNPQAIQLHGLMIWALAMGYPGLAEACRTLLLVEVKQ